MALNKQVRSPQSPSPIYGIRPGFNIGDFEKSAAPSIPAISSTLTTGRSSAGTSGAIATNARVVKVTIVVTSTTPTDKATVDIKTALDSYSASAATYANLTPGTYDFYLGGWSSPLGDSSNGTYVATQYGPDSSSNSNYSGGNVYNPVEFMSLDGYALKAVTSAFSGSPTVDVSFTQIS